MADLQGPKIRVGKFDGGKIELVPGAKFILDADRTELGNQDIASLDYKELPRDVKPGDTLLLNDGLLVLTVEAVRGAQVHTIVKLGGELSNNKGINKQGGGLTAPALTGKDMEDIKTAMSFQCEYLAVSFPKNATDMEMARQLANVAGEPYRHKPAMIAKIERYEAIPHLEAILKASDGIMVARGDLAVEVGNAAVPALQKRMIKMARELDKVSITATQMMESMIVNPVPTRAEVSDVANAVLDGTDAVMLSAETAAGKYPIETVEQMANIALEAERAEFVTLDTDFAGRQFGRIDQSIAMGRAVHRLPPRLQGHPGADRVRLDGAVDESPPHPGAHLRADDAADQPAQDGAVPQRAAHPDAQVRRPRHGVGRGREDPRRPWRADARRHLRHHLRRAHGLPGRHQHAEGLPGRLTTSAAAGLAAPRNLPRFADGQREERVVAQAQGRALACQLARRLVQGLVGQLEGAPVHAERTLGAQVGVDLQRLLDIDVLLLHEPARLVGADGDQRDVEAAVRLSLREALADGGEVA